MEAFISEMRAVKHWELQRCKEAGPWLRSFIFRKADVIHAMRADQFLRHVCDLCRMFNVTGDQVTWAGVCWQKRVESVQRDQIKPKVCCCQELTLAISCGWGTPNQSQSWFLDIRTVARSLSLKHKAHASASHLKTVRGPASAQTTHQSVSLSRVRTSSITSGSSTS